MKAQHAHSLRNRPGQPRGWGKKIRNWFSGAGFLNKQILNNDVDCTVGTLSEIGPPLARVPSRSVDFPTFSHEFDRFSYVFLYFCWPRGAGDLQRCSTDRALIALK